MDDDEERQLRIELMQTQIEHFRRQMRWEPYKAIAAIVGASAAMTAATLALAGWLASHGLHLG